MVSDHNSVLECHEDPKPRKRNIQRLDADLQLHDFVIALAIRPVSVGG